VYICVLMSCSTPYCLCDTLMDPWSVCIYVVHQYSNNPDLTRLSHKYIMFAVCLPITYCDTPCFGCSDTHTSIVAYTSDILSNRTKVTVSCLCQSRLQEQKRYDALAYLRTEEGKIHTSILNNLQKPAKNCVHIMLWHVEVTAHNTDTAFCSYTM
jgi:hypothetical protein